MYEGGTLVDSDSASYCDIDLVGNEFAPLAEIENGVENPYSDQTRGRIAPVTSMAGLTEITLDQPKFLQNLGGYNSILGKSIFVTQPNLGNNPPVETVACCVIAQKAAPVLEDDSWRRPTVVAVGGHPHSYNSYPQAGTITSTPYGNPYGQTSGAPQYYH